METEETQPETENNALCEKESLPTDRGLLKCILFMFVTFGFYPLYLIQAASQELNITCEGDGKKTVGIVLFILFSVMTVGIYSIVWFITVCERMKNRIERAGATANISGLSWFIWSTFGIFLFGAGPFVALYKMIHSLNQVNDLYKAGR